MADVIIVHQFEIFIIIVFGMHISFIILEVLTIMEVPLPRSHIGVSSDTCASLLIITEWSLKESHDLPIWDANTWQMMLLFFCSFIQCNI